MKFKRSVVLLMLMFFAVFKTGRLQSGFSTTEDVTTESITEYSTTNPETTNVEMTSTEYSTTEPDTTTVEMTSTEPETSSMTTSETTAVSTEFTTDYSTETTDETTTYESTTFETTMTTLATTKITPTKPVTTINCITCEWDENRPATTDKNCYLQPTNFSDKITVENCTHTFPYCKTEFTFVDDVVTQVNRGCTNGTDDSYLTFNSKPINEKCSTILNPNDEVEITKCLLPCDSENECNDQRLEHISELNLCSASCLNGRCNYSSGKCKCDEGYYGDNCDIETTTPSPIRNCIQCDSETTNCTAFNKSSPCSRTEQLFCSVIETKRYNKEGKINRQVLTRGCTDKFYVEDECFINNAHESGGNDVEYTCISTCDFDGCNDRIPDGIAEEVQPLKCVVCDSDYGLDDCESKNDTTLCPSSATHCLSRVTYFLSEKTDLRTIAEPEYELESVWRGCAMEEVVKECTKTIVGRSNLIKYSCAETCSYNGCNTGWPARPKCSQCQCSRCTLDDECNSNPPLPVDCPTPYHEYCTIEDVDRSVDTNGYNNGYPRMITRGCSFQSIGNKETASAYGDNVKNTNRSCTTDGCNLGYFPFIIPTSGSSSLSFITPLLALLIMLAFMLK